MSLIHWILNIWSSRYVLISVLILLLQYWRLLHFLYKWHLKYKSKKLPEIFHAFLKLSMKHRKSYQKLTHKAIIWRILILKWSLKLLCTVLKLRKSIMPKNQQNIGTYTPNHYKPPLTGQYALDPEFNKSCWVKEWCMLETNINLRDSRFNVYILLFFLNS